MERNKRENGKNVKRITGKNYVKKIEKKSKDEKMGSTQREKWEVFKEKMERK